MLCLSLRSIRQYLINQVLWKQLMDRRNKVNSMQCRRRCIHAMLLSILYNFFHSSWSLISSTFLRSKHYFQHRNKHPHLLHKAHRSISTRILLEFQTHVQYLLYKLIDRAEYFNLVQNLLIEEKIELVLQYSLNLISNLKIYVCDNIPSCNIWQVRNYEWKLFITFRPWP